MADTIPVRNPRTGEIDFRITPPGDDELSAIAARLRAAQPDWAARPFGDRIAILYRFAEAVEARHDAILAALIEDTGRKRESLSEANCVRGMVARWEKWGPEQLAESRDKDTAIPFLKIDAQRVPYPLLGVVSPWNFPMLLSLIDAIPALAAGSAALIKPSEVTPRFVEPLSEAIAAVPEIAAVLAYVEGDGRTGAAVIDQADIVCFTGSVATGRKVAAQAAANFIPAFLELGGKDPAIVLAGADLDRAAAGLAWGASANTGQACQSIERIYVEAPVHDEFVEKLTARVGALKLALPTVEDGEVGPLIFARQAEIIRDHLTDALEKGAKIAVGHGPEQIEGGWYVKPMVLTNVDHTMKIMREETFGPILPVMPVGDADEAVRLANDSEYGLSGSVWAESVERATEIARRLDVGGVSVNDTTLTAMMQEGEKMSFKLSGMGGSRMGPSGITRFLRQKVLIKNTGAWDPWWYAQPAEE